MTIALLLALPLAWGVPPAPVAADEIVTPEEFVVSPIPRSATMSSYEPAVAAHPTDPNRVAVIYARGVGPVRPQLRISHDGGRTYRTVPGPGGGGYHIVAAWGPGPTAGTARLYVANMQGRRGAMRLGIRFTDDEGAHWSRLRLMRMVPGWIGGTPDLVTDNDPGSPNYGTLYATWNWPASATTGPGLRVVASSDYGTSFQHVEVPPIGGVTGYPAAMRIGYRLAPAPDGALYVTWYEASLRRYRGAVPLDKGGPTNIGRIAVGLARLVYDRATGSFTLGPSRIVTTLPRTPWNFGHVRPDGLITDPQWTITPAVDHASGRLLVAVAVNRSVRIAASDDAGESFTTVDLPPPDPINGREQWLSKPALVAGDGFAAVFFRLLDRSGASSSHGYSLSVDGGASWSAPLPISAVRWAGRRLRGGINGIGLRDRAALLADGRTVLFAYGDGRFGVAGSHRSAIVAARLAPLATERESLIVVLDRSFRAPRLAFGVLRHRFGALPLDAPGPRPSVSR